MSNLSVIEFWGGILIIEQVVDFLIVWYVGNLSGGLIQNCKGDEWAARHLLNEGAHH